MTHLRSGWRSGILVRRVGRERLEGGAGGSGLKPYHSIPRSLPRATARVRPPTPSLE